MRKGKTDIQEDFSVADGAKIDAIQTDGTLPTNSDTKLVTEQAVKTHVANELSGISSDALIKAINQTTHGFVVGDWLRNNGSVYVKAIADSDTNAEVLGVVSTVTDVDNFSLTTSGYVTGLSGLTAGEGHFLDPDTAGAITDTATTTEGDIIKPILIADSATSGFVVNMLGTEVVATTSFYQSFVDANLSSGVLTVTHNLGHKFCIVQIFDNNDDKINPDDITLTGNNTLDIDLTSFGTITGTWQVVVLDIGTTTNIQGNSVTATSTITDNAVPRGDGGVRGVQDSSMTISDDGEMLNPFQPAFQARGDSLQNNILPNTNVILTASSVQFNVGSHYDEVNTFTAPITGKYQINADIRLRNIDSGATSYEFHVITSNQTFQHQLDPRQYAGDIAGDYNLAVSYLMDMDISDTLICRIRQVNGTQQTDVDSFKFSAFLVA